MDDNETVDNGEQPAVEETNLDSFEDDFYNKKPPVEEAEVVEETEEEEDSEEVDDLEAEDEGDEQSDEEGEDPEEEEEPEAVKKKPNAKARINELTAEKYEERRAKEAALARAAALERELETLKAGREKEEPTPLREQLPQGAPDPDEILADGEPKYPLGEFDKNYIRDLTKFTIEAETKAVNERRAQEEWEQGVKAAQQELANSWIEKVDKAEETIPTLRDDISGLTSTFENIDPNYGEYLAMTIMGSENGPEIMHYFSQNIGEAQKIVASGPAAATLAIGRLDARLSKPSTRQDEQKRNKKVSNAPNPPLAGARGVNGRQSVKPDTPNLEAFEDLFYDRKKL